MWALHRLARGSKGSCRGAEAPSAQLGWVGIQPDRYVWPQNWQEVLQRCGEASEPGKEGEQLAHLCKKRLPSQLGTLWQRDRVDGCPAPAQLGFWGGAFRLQGCQLPGTKNTALKHALLCTEPCKKTRLGWQKAASWHFLCTSGRAQSAAQDHYQKNWDRELHTLTQPLLASPSLWLNKWSKLQAAPLPNKRVFHFLNKLRY